MNHLDGFNEIEFDPFESVCISNDCCIFATINDIGSKWPTNG